MKIREFGVEIWMNETENHCIYNLAETCVESITIKELLTLSGKNDTDLSALLPMKMTYGAIEGSDRLRDAICKLYTSQKYENIIVTHGTIGANALIYETLVSPQDRMISVKPTYQQHYSIPESYGADVQILELREENRFLPDLEELRRLATPDTKLIAINNPNNPTGALMDREMLLEIADIARSCDAWLLCDEVYRGTDQTGNGSTESVADLYEKGISTASISKAYSLAGLRLGWIAAPREVVQAVSIHRDYNTISVGMINDYFATMALEHSEKLLSRSRDITRTNLAALDEWIANEPAITYVKPMSGTTALLKFDLDMTSREFCLKLLEKTGVLFTPGSALDMEGYVRIGYANNPDVLQQGLTLVSEFLQKQQN
jgi:aspartate/methionine/tyrosine aminotransferase